VGDRLVVVDDQDDRFGLCGEFVEQRRYDIAEGGGPGCRQEPGRNLAPCAAEVSAART
jgi:hypothetical protein